MIDARKLYVLTTLAALAVLTAGCSTTGSNCAGVSGLKSCFCFNEGKGETVKSCVGQGAGKIMGGLKWVDGKDGKALEFNGKGYVLVDHCDAFNAPTFTFTAWTKLKNNSDYQYIVWKNGPEFPDVGPGRRMDMWVDVGGAVTAMWHTKDSSEHSLSGSKSIADNNWHHVAEVYDGKSIKLYIDGCLDAEEKAAGEINPKNDTKMWIGARPGDVAASGIIDKVMFFDRALTSDEIKKLGGAK